MRAREEPRRWSGQGAGRPRGPSAAGAARAPCTRCLLRAGVPGRRDISTCCGRPGVGGGEVSRSEEDGGVGGRHLRPLHSYSDTIGQRVSSPVSGSPGRFRCPESGGDNKCPWGWCLPPPPPPKSRLWRSSPPSGCPEAGPQPGLSGALPAGQRPEASWTRRTPGLDGVSSARCQAITRTPASGWDEELKMRVFMSELSTVCV